MSEIEISTAATTPPKTVGEIVTAIATAKKYSEKEISAGIVFSDRKSRRTDPPGRFDRAGRFYARERTNSVRTCRSPSRAYPYPEMRAARTADHCAEVIGADNVTHVRRIALACDRLWAGSSEDDIRKLLTPGLRARSISQAADHPTAD